MLRPRFVYPAPPGNTESDGLFSQRPLSESTPLSNPLDSIISTTHEWNRLSPRKEVRRQVNYTGLGSVYRQGVGRSRSRPCCPRPHSHRAAFRILQEEELSRRGGTRLPKSLPAWAGAPKQGSLPTLSAFQLPAAARIDLPAQVQPVDHMPTTPISAACVI